jgi:hypothetical protein
MMPTVVELALLKYSSLLIVKYLKAEAKTKETAARKLLSPQYDI